MKENRLVILCLRLMGIYIGALGLNQLSGVLSMVLEGRGGITSYSFGLGGAILIIFGLVLVIYAPKLRHFVVRSDADGESTTHVSASERTAKIALSILGIFILAESLPELTQRSISVGLYYASIEEIPRSLRYGPYAHAWTNLIGPSIRLAISAVLIMGPDRIVGYIARYDQTVRRLKSSENTNSADMKKPDA